MSKINLTPAEVRTHASTIEGIADDLRNVNLTLKTMSDEVLAPWKGKAKDEFNTAFTEFYPKLQDASAILREISMNLNATATVIEHVDGQSTTEPAN